jgi:phage terminase large subunit
MRSEVLEASLYHPLAPEIKELLLNSGVVPINDIYLEENLWDNKNKINLLYGSYGSGKSIFIVDELIDKCIHDEYFRCYFGRKILETVRGTVFKTITDRIKELKKAHLFSFSDAPNGTMIIVCKKNGNTFYPFGANNADSLKSIKDPTHFFCEELDQFAYEDFGPIYSRLRTEKALTQFYGAFNTEKIYQSHWIRKLFFDGEFAGQARKVKANYYHNYFIDREDYYSKLQLIANGNAAVLNAIANGEWGAVRSGNEFYKQFDETKHVRKLSYEPGAIWCSLDDNVNPYVTNTIWQVRGKSANQIHEILTKNPDNNAPKAATKFADYLDSIGHKDVVLVCGDPSSSKRTTVDENSASFYVKFIEVLTKRGYHVVNKVMRSAPEVALSGAFVNAIFENNIYGWVINIGDRCFSSIEEYMLVKENAEGQVFKEEVTDKETKIRYQIRGHIADSFRYFILTILAAEFQLYKGIRKSNIANNLGMFR